jgi:hypothetical protein
MTPLYLLATLILAVFLLGSIARLVSAQDDAAAAGLKSAWDEDRARRWVYLAWAWVILFSAALVAVLAMMIWGRG